MLVLSYRYQVFMNFSLKNLKLINYTLSQVSQIMKIKITKIKNEGDVFVLVVESFQDGG